MTYRGERRRQRKEVSSHKVLLRLWLKEKRTLAITTFAYNGDLSDFD